MSNGTKMKLKNSVDNIQEGSTTKDMAALWKKSAVIGAAGKMGRGIALILLLEMALAEAREKSIMGTGEYRLELIDANRDSLAGLKDYLRTHLKKYAERQINELRGCFSKNQKLISNRDIIDYFVEKGLEIAHISASLAEATDIPVVFEAVLEDLHVKTDLFKKLVNMQTKPPYIFTNTSSIPISRLDQEAQLNGKIIGFHLYNPPAVQKLLEIIPLENGDADLPSLALEIGRRLKKKIIISKDVAGFIGNGHFVREIAQAVKMVKQLSTKYCLLESIYMVNKITGDFLLRPMGIFQLVDYVGLDVMQNVGGIMNKYLEKPVYDSNFLKSFIDSGLKGGQFPDGSQKEGIFCYSDHKIEGIYDSAEKRYRKLSENQLQSHGDEILGKLPESYVPWSILNKDPKSIQKIEGYLQQLEASKEMGCQMASQFLRESAQIASTLVTEHVASSKEDVKTVLKNGFYHLYANF